MRRYFLEILNGNHRIATGNPAGYATLAEAKTSALRWVDDALPDNTVRILHEVAYAYLAGDSGNEVADVEE